MLRGQELSKYPALANRWENIRTIRIKMVQDAHERAEEAQRGEREKLALEISSLLQKGEQKSRLARELFMSRSTLDNLLKEFKQSAKLAYFFDRGFGTSVWIKGKLPDTGGFPSLSGDVEARFLNMKGAYVAMDDLTGQHKHGAAEKEFLTERYGVEATAWAVAEGLTKPAPVEDWEVEDEI
jgi:hypothetical protein